LGRLEASEAVASPRSRQVRCHFGSISWGTYDFLGTTAIAATMIG
jgi:hypothetical protein